MNKKLQWICAFTALGLTLGGVGIALGNMDKLIMRGDKNSTQVSAAVTPPTVVIDPGHGGEDGGCSAEDGTTEKELNLKVSENLRDILNAAGYSAVLTREEDTLLYDMYGELDNYKGKKKVFDLKNRLRFAGESGAGYLVSIHMNKFPDKKYSGLQVYYSQSSGQSVALADRIQEYTRTYLQPDNERMTKKAGSSIYILNRAEMPAVLVECGFLSNDSERERLKDGEYRKKLSLCIASAIIDSVEADRARTQEK